MSLIEESYLQHLLNECDAYFGREGKEARQAVSSMLAEVYRILTQNIKETFEKFSLDTIVRFMELTVEIDDKFKYAEQFVHLFFQRVVSPSQFYIRALLVKAKFIAYSGHKSEEKGEAMINILKDSIQEISKALDLISGPAEVPKGKDSKGGSGGGDSNKTRYSFLVYNASTCLYNITRFMLRQSWQKNFTDIYERIYKLFEELDEPDQNWRCQFTLILFQCLYDNDKKADAFKILDLLWERAKSKNYENLDTLFRLRVHYSKENGALSNIIKKDIEGPDPNGWKILEVLQRMRSGAIPEAQVQKQLMGVVNQISLGVLSSNEQNASVTLSPIMQERLGEAGRIALKFNIINIAYSITTFLGKARQPNQKAMVLNEYNKAELMIKKKAQFVDKKTGMMMNTLQIKELEIESRKEAIRVLEKVMIINKKLGNPDLIYEGALLIWNTSLPFMCPQYRSFIAKAFDISVQLLEQIDSVDHDIRTKMHLELAKIYFGNQQMFPEVEKNILRAIKLDHSIPVAKLQFKFEPEEDPSLYHRPYDRYLQSFREKILLKAMQNIDPHPLDTVITDLWNVLEQKSETARIDTLQKCLRTLLTVEEEQYKVDESKMLVDEQIKEEKIIFDQKKLRLYKKKKLLAAQIAELAFEWELNDFAKKASEFVLADKWEVKNSIELIIVQAKCCYFVGQIKIDELVQENFEVPLAGAVVAQSEESGNAEISEEKKLKVQEKKKKIFQMFGKGLELAESIQQHWLVFNGGIYIWNNFLHIFRNPVNDSQLHSDLSQLLKKFFESMKNSLKEIEQKNIVYYDLDTKIQTFANIGLMNARLMQSNKQSDEVMKICQSLLVTTLSPHTRKLINSIKARVGGGKAASGGKDQKKGGKDAPPEKAGGYNDTFLFQIFSQLEIIQNSTNKAETQNLIKKCFESLESWQPKQKDETELELHAELWARLSRLAVNQSNTQMLKYGIRCADYSLSLFDPNSISTIPANRLRWYSLAEFLYSECLLKISNPETQDVESYDKLLFGALSHAVQATHKGYKSNINALVVDGAKQVWNICSKLQESQRNRSKLILPIKTVLHYLKEIKEDGEVDLVLLLAQLFFRAANENNESKIGEEVADMLFSLIPKNLQKSIWQAKMVFMSKQNKNELQAISNMKEADPSLQAKLWVKLARISVNAKKQFTAYNKAIDILKKQNSVEIVEVLMEYAEWQLRVGNEKISTVCSNLLLASDYLIDIEFGDEDDEDDEDGEEDRGTVFSRSTRGKKSHTSKSIKSSMKDKIKKPSEKKGQSSSKSKAGSNVSRMNRSGRVAKTTKSKNAKSIFSQREEDPNPDNLNCIHFERLFRIHTMLAMISDNVTNRIRYALDAKQFLVKILEISFNTLREIQENSMKFADKNQKQENFSKFNLPANLKEWVNLELGKQFCDKIKILEDANFMGTYSFEKPELTFTYMRHLTKILNSYGLNYYSIPIYCMQKLFASQILGNKLFSNIVELEMVLNLRKIGYEDSEKPNITKIDSGKYVLSVAEKKMENAKTQSKLVEDKSEENIFQSSSPVNLIKPFSSHQGWHEIGKLLIEFGEINSAKSYLKQALNHYRTLAIHESAGECCIYLLWIASCEGENSEAMEYAVIANKLCKNVENWEKLLYYSCQFLLRLRKYEDVEGFASKIYETVSDLVAGLSKENSEKLMFESEIIELKDILILVELIDLQLRFSQSTHQDLANGSIVILKALNQLNERIMDEGLWKIRHYELFYKISSEIINYFIFGRDKNSHISREVFSKTFDLMLRIEKKFYELMKYTLIGTGQEFNNNQIIKIYRKYRFLVASAYIYQSISDLDDSLPPSGSFGDEERDVVMEMAEVDENQKLKKYMKTLDKKIYEQMKAIPTALPPIESSISLLSNLKSSINPEMYQMIEWKVLNMRARTLKAKSMKELESMWKTAVSEEQDQGQEEDNPNPNAALSLAAFQEFLDENCEDKILDYSLNPKSNQLAQLLYESFVENSGQQIAEQSFEYLSKLQHSAYNSKVLQRLRDNLGSTHRLNSYLSLLEEVEIDPVESRKILSSNKIFSAWNNFMKYEECLALMPRNAIYVVLQLNVDHSQLYCGILVNEKGEQDYKTRVMMKKNQIDKSQLHSYQVLRNKMNKIKKEIAYLAYSDDQKFDDLIVEKEKMLNEIVNKLDLMSQWWLSGLIEVMNTVKESTEPQEADKGKKAAKDTKKKAGKDEVAGYESPLGATPAGFESLTFLIDDEFEGLPFDQLSGLDKVPSISFDSSLFYLSRKMQAMGYKSEANNSNGFGMDKGKYISYAFKDPQVSFKGLSAKITTQSSNVKFQGLSSEDRIPSKGDYSRFLSQNGFLHIYGSLDFLNYIKVPLLVQNAGLNKSRLLIVTDHLNYRKSLINKFQTLDENSQPNSIDDESRILNAVADLLDMNLVKNNWTSNIQMNHESVLAMYKNLGSGYYIGALNNIVDGELKEGESKPQRRLFEKLIHRIHGCPVLRM